MAISLTLTEGDDWVIPLDLDTEDGTNLDLSNMEFEARYAASPNLPAKSFEVVETDDGIELHLDHTETSKLGSITRLYFDVVGISSDPETHTTYLSGIINVRRGVGR